MRSGEKILFSQKIEEIFDKSSDSVENSVVPIESVFGIWKDRNITKEMLRRRAWMKIEQCSN
jgi:hypothetical protein